MCLTRSKGVFSALYSIILHCNTCEHYAEYGVCLTSLTRSKGVFSAGDFPGPCCRQGLASQCHTSLTNVDHASPRNVDVHYCYGIRMVHCVSSGMLLLLIIIEVFNVMTTPFWIVNVKEKWFQVSKHWKYQCCCWWLIIIIRMIMVMIVRVCYWW